VAETTESSRESARRSSSVFNLERTAGQFRECHFLPLRNHVSWNGVQGNLKLTTEFRSRSSGDGGTSKWKRRFLKVYGQLSCAVHFQEAERVKT